MEKIKCNAQSESAIAGKVQYVHRKYAQYPEKNVNLKMLRESINMEVRELLKISQEIEKDYLN